MKSPFRAALITLVAVFFVLPLSLHAQTTSPSPSAAIVERIITLDHPIPVAETESALPVVVYTAGFLQKHGANTPIEGLRELPSFVGTTATENDSNGGNGSAAINLRALGPESTLILINGRRAFALSDINAIAIGSLSRTEILKDGAGVIYGSDAVGGVVNFILINGPGEKPYEGAELFALYGNTTDSDAHVRQVYLKGGVTGLDGKVSIAAAGEYYSRANLYSRDREISRTADLSNDSTGLGFGGLNNNSPTYAGRVSIATAQGGAPAGQLTLINQSTVNVTPASYRAFDVPPGTDPNRFNFRAFTPAIPAVEKAMYFVTGRYKIFGDGLQLYGDILDSHTKQDNGQAGTPFTLSSAAGQGTAGRSEARASQFNPFADNLGSVRYRLQQEFPAASGRRSFFDHDYQRYVAGINGDFDHLRDNAFISRFGYDTGFVYEDFSQNRTDSGDARRSYIRALIAPPGFVNPVAPLPSTPFAGTFNPFIGQFAPITGTAPIYNNTNPTAPQFKTGVPIGTAPYDNSLATLDWTQGGAFYIGHSSFFERDFLYDAKANAHFFPNWWNGGIDAAVGYEHREANSKQIPDVVQASGDQLGFNQQAPLKFRQEVDSWFFEVAIPLITSSMNVPFVRSLDLSLAWRHEEFTDTNLLQTTPPSFSRSASFANDNPDENFGGSPRLALRYQPIPDLVVRASWGQSIRPPDFVELFTPITEVFTPLFGVGFPPLPPPVIASGNPTLKAETTDSYSAGVVWAPKYAPGFTMTADFYQLYTTNLILEPETFAQVLIDQNILAPRQVDPTGAPFCDASIDPVTNIGVVRDANGTVQCVYSPFGNAGKRHVQGLDVTAIYEIPTERWGKFTFSGGWNHFFTWKAQPGTGPYRSFLGNYDNQTLPFVPGAIPWNKGFLRGEWEWRHLDLVATGNYVGDFRDDPAFDNFNYPRDGRRNVPSYLTLDLQLSYEFVKPPPEPAPYVKESKSVTPTAADTSSIWQRLLWGTRLTVGVNNAFDRNPPTVLAAFNDNYDTSLYSIRNRYYYVALTKKF
ncbi:MAG TPA: TonB-dependent receptor [Chthoniobacterales bacterium]|nr:TonB-dependent receptor [Chthoniobacterales bacterium]